MSTRVRARLCAVVPEKEAKSTSQLARLLFQVEEAERRRIGRDLHDETAQGLAVVRFYLEMLQELSANRNTQKTVVEAMDVLDLTIEGLRRIMARLSPQALERLGLIKSIRKEARRLAGAGVTQVSVKVSSHFGRLAPEIELALYRVVQEALHNVAKHAQAKHVEINLSRDGEKITLVVNDDGTGFGRPADFGNASYGVFGMRERISSLGGSFRIRSRRGRGTRIEVSISGLLVSSAKTVRLAAPRPPGEQWATGT